MAVVSRICTLEFDNGLGSFRRWIATAASQDTAEGSSVVVTVTQAASSSTPPGVADTLTLNFYNDSGILIRSASLTPSSSSQTVTFHFTDTGNSGGSSRHGTVEIAIRATKTTGGPTATYDYETDGSPSTPPTTFSATQVDRGWIRGTTTLTHSISNVSAGGSKNSPASFPDPLHVRLTTGSTAYVTVAYTAGLKESSTTKRTRITNSTTQTWDAAFTGTSTTTGRVNEGLSASSHTLISFATVPNASLTGQPYTSITTETTDSITTDPRLTVTHLFQVDDNSYGTPPLSKNRASGQRLTSEQAFMAARMTNARGEGQNNITWSMTLTPVAPGTTISNTGIVSATQGGQDGWGSSTFTSWSSSLPGGTWNKAIDVTDPSDIDADTHLVGGTAAYTLLAVNPNLRIIAGGGNASASARHFQPGDPLTLAAALRDISTSQYASVDSSPAPAVVLLRMNPTLGRGEYLRASDYTWVAAASATADSFTMTQSAGDSGVWVKTFTAEQTAGWGTLDFAFVPKLYNNGTPYTTSSTVTVLGSLNPHDSQDFDPTGLFK